jgi:hypothetical protein
LSNLGILGGDQYQLIAEQIDARVILDDLLLHPVIHPLQISEHCSICLANAELAP